MESIHELMQRVREHPDFAGGTVFVREDVAYALFGDEADEDPDLEPEIVARVTDAMLQESQKVIEHWIFEGVYGWDEAMRDNIEVEDDPA